MSLAKTNTLRLVLTKTDAGPLLSIGKFEKEGPVFRSDRCSWIIAAALIAVVLPQVAYGQAGLKDANACAKCIVLSDPLIIGDSVGPGKLDGQVRTVARDAKGDIWVGTYRQNGAVRVFGPTGRFVGLRNSDRVDSGYHVQSLVRRGPADSMYVFDGGVFKTLVFSPDGQLARSFRTAVEGTTDLVVMKTGQMIFAANMATSEAAGYPLHVVGPTGQLARSMGVEIPVYNSSAAVLIDRRLAASFDKTTFWSVSTATYSFERMRPNGTVVETFRRNARWFDSASAEKAESNPLMPLPQVAAVFEAPNKLVWVTVLVPDSRWRQNSHEGAPTPEGKRTWAILDYDKYFDTVIEVIDPVRRVVLASNRVDECLPYLLDDEHVASFGSTRNGIAVLKVRSIKLQLPSK